MSSLQDRGLARLVFAADLDPDTADDLARMCPTPTLPTCPSAEVLALEQALARERRYVSLLRTQVVQLERQHELDAARADRAEGRLADVERRAGILREGRLWRPRVEGMVTAMALMLMGAAAWLV